MGRFMLEQDNFGGLNELARAGLKADSKRAQIGRPLPREIILTLNTILPSVKKNLSEKLSGDGVREQLMEFKLNVEKNLGIGLSRSSLCANFIYSRAESLLWNREEAVNKQIFEQEDEESFRFFYDFLEGLGLVLGPLVAVENQDICEKVTIAQLSCISEAFDISVSDEVDCYLSIKDSDRFVSELLGKDHSGFLAVDILTGKIKADRENLFSAKEYILAGAETARDLYKKLHRIIELLYPDRKQE